NRLGHAHWASGDPPQFFLLFFCNLPSFGALQDVHLRFSVELFQRADPSTGTEFRQRRLVLGRQRRPETEKVQSAQDRLRCSSFLKQVERDDRVAARAQLVEDKPLDVERETRPGKYPDGDSLYLS